MDMDYLRSLAVKVVQGISRLVTGVVLLLVYLALFPVAVWARLRCLARLRTQRIDSSLERFRNTELTVGRFRRPW